MWIGGGGCTRTELDDGGGVPTGETFPQSSKPGADIHDANKLAGLLNYTKFLLTLVRRVNMNGRCWPQHKTTAMKVKL